MTITTTHDCAAYLIDRRFSCRRIAQFLSAIHDENSQDRRQARKFRETNNPILMRRADTLEAQAKRRSDALQNGRDLLLKWGRELIELSPHIDAAVSQPLLLDLLNVNRADRERVSQEDGLIEIAYIKGLEDSAMYRCDGWKQGPLAQAVMRAINHELLHNDQLKQAAHEHLFGKGGMCEFLPTYRMAPSGEMERQPPKLRLADECDAKNEVA